MIRVTPDSWDIWDDEPDQTQCPLTTLWAKMQPAKGSAPQYLNATGHSGCCWGGRIKKHFEEFARFAHIADTFGVYPDGDMVQLGRVGSYPNLTSSGLAGYGVSSLKGIFPQPPPVANCTVYQLLGIQHSGTAYDPSRRLSVALIFGSARTVYGHDTVEHSSLTTDHGRRSYTIPT